MISNILPGEHHHFIELEDGSGAYARLWPEEAGAHEGLADVEFKRNPSPRSLARLLAWFFDLIRKCPGNGVVVIILPDGCQVQASFAVARGTLDKLVVEMGAQV